MEKKGHINPNTSVVPNGVNYDAFSTPVSEPADMCDIPHPRVGYVGKIKTQLDIDLLVTLARRHRYWSFVFVGPKKPLGNEENSFQELLSMPNVYYLGAKPLHALPGYVQHMDVCMLPYLRNGYTKFIYPLKLHECLAAGRPVVGSAIRSLEEFEGVIKLARMPEEWSSALTKSLVRDANDPARQEARRAVAREHDWGRLVELIVRALCERLGPSYLERYLLRPKPDNGVPTFSPREF